MYSRWPLSLVVVTRTPESKLALDRLARAQFSARALANSSSAAFFLSASAASACFFLASSSLSLPLSLGTAGVGLAAGDTAADRSAACAGTPLEPGRRRMFLAGTSPGGDWSLN